MDLIALRCARDINLPARLFNLSIVDIDDRLRTLIIIYADIVLKVTTLILCRRLKYELRANVNIAVVIVVLIFVGSSQTTLAIDGLVNIHQAIKTMVHGSFVYVPIAMSFIVIVGFDVD